MYKPKPMNDADIDKYLAQLAALDDPIDTKVRAALARAYKVPEPRLGILWAIAGGLMFSGALCYLGWILYGVYEKIHGGIR